MLIKDEAYYKDLIAKADAKITDLDEQIADLHMQQRSLKKSLDILWDKLLDLEEKNGG